MAIFDIFEEVSERSVTKTDTGDSRIFGVVVGEVVKNYSDDYPDRVCVMIHTRDKDANVLQWARVAMPYAGSEWGFYFLPEIGDQVLIAFEEGIIDRPYVVGCVQKASDKFMKKNADSLNTHKKIRTRQGSTIEIDDKPADNGKDTGDGTKDRIRVYTPDEAHSMEMDNEKKLIKIMDKDKNALIEMKTEKGQITIQAAEKIFLKAGDNVVLAMNGANGADKITVKCKDFVMETTGKIEMKGTQKVSLEGASASVKSQGMLSLEANGVATLKGMPIKIG